jgi:hypothetical protein
MKWMHYINKARSEFPEEWMSHEPKGFPGVFESAQTPEMPFPTKASEFTGKALKHFLESPEYQKIGFSGVNPVSYLQGAGQNIPEFQGLDIDRDQFFSADPSNSIGTLAHEGFHDRFANPLHGHGLWPQPGWGGHDDIGNMKSPTGTLEGDITNLQSWIEHTKTPGGNLWSKIMEMCRSNPGNAPDVPLKQNLPLPPSGPAPTSVPGDINDTGKGYYRVPAGGPYRGSRAPNGRPIYYE